MPTQTRKPSHTIADEALTLNIVEAARRAGVSRETFRALMDAGCVQFVRLPSGTRRVPTAAIDSWIEQNLERATP